MAATPLPDQLPPTWTLDEVLATLPKLPAQDLTRFLKATYPNEPLDTWDQAALLELSLALLQAWEQELPARDFLIRATAALCRASFEAFVRLFWDEVPGSRPILWNWHMTVFCEELSIVARAIFAGETRPHDLICNVSPGSSKSTLWSILFPCWVWTNMPEASLITASHTDSLVTDLASKSRDLMKGEMYRLLFPEIEFTESQDSKGHYRNTEGGERYTCTVGGKSPIGKHANFIICLPGETPIITDRGEIPIAEIVEKKLPVKVLGYCHETDSPVWRQIEEYESSPGRPVCRVNFSDGSSIEATGEHPVYVCGKGYVATDQLKPGDEVIYVRKMQRVRLRRRVVQSRRKTRPALLLHTQMLGQTSARVGHVPMSGLRDEDLCNPLAYGEERAQTCLLFQKVLAQEGNGRWAPALFENQEKMSELREGDSGNALPRQDSFLLQPRLPGRVFTRAKQPAILQEKSTMRVVRQRNDENPCFYQAPQLLFAGLRKQRPCSAYGRGWKPEVPRWYRTEAIPSNISKNKRHDKKARRPSLLYLLKNRKIFTKRVGCSPHRQEQEEQHQRELSSTLSKLSQDGTRQRWQAREMGRRVVSSVVVGVRLPAKVYNLRIAETHNYFANRVLLHNCDDPIDPKKVLSEAERKTASDFMTKVIPTRRMRGTKGDICATLLVMQRLGQSDPTDVMLEIAAKPGAAPVRHILLPSEITDHISPPELKKYYEGNNEDGGCAANGLMDPVRFSRKVLDEQRAILGEWAYSGQFLQKPRPLAGGMFKIHWFSHRARASPLRSRRIRYWDRASSREESACFTAGTLMCYDGERLYVENVVHGKWEPDERNAVMLATAQRDRSRYGKHEPIIYVEAEGGSSGRDAWLGVVRALIGFHVREDRVQGSKDTRAEPWATQLAAGNVFIVDNGESEGFGHSDWDIDAFVSEHLSFRPEPGKRLGKWKDMVDSASGCFNLLVGLKRAWPALTTYQLINKKSQARWLVACSAEELSLLDLSEQRVLVIWFTDPAPPAPGPALNLASEPDSNSGDQGVAGSASHQSWAPGPSPVHSCLDRTKAPPTPFPKNLGTLEVSCADLDPADHQAHYGEIIEPWQQPVSSLQLSRDQAKRLWAHALKKYDAPWQVLVLVDQGGEDRRALSAAMAMADILRIPRSAIFLPGAENKEELVEDSPPNLWVFDQIKMTRGLVAS